jgi:hypothetical protein
MTFDPDYGQTLLSDEDQVGLTSEVRELLGDPILKADLYDLEQLIQAQVADEFVQEILEGSLTLDDLLTDYFVRELHRRMYEPVWTWGGRQRSRETNIGVAPEQITVMLRTSLDDIRFRWAQEDRVSARSLGITAHAELVHIHPFVDIRGWQRPNDKTPGRLGVPGSAGGGRRARLRLELRSGRIYWIAPRVRRDS